MARILFLTQVLPYPLDSGAKIRAHYVLRHLVRENEVTLVSFVRAEDRTDYIEHLERFCQSVHTVRMQRSRFRDARALLVAGCTGQPVIIVRDEIEEMRATLKRLVTYNSYNVVHADQTSMAQYALYATSQADCIDDVGRAKLLLDAHNALYRIPQRLAAHETNPLKRLLLRREAHALAHYEAELLEKFDHVVFVAEQDRIALQTKRTNHNSGVSDHSLPCTMIPICVDPGAQPLIQRASRLRTVTHLGTMFWPPNVEGVLWFAREIFPQVLARVPDARFVVVGKNPPKEVRDLVGQVPNIQITGYVSDPEPYLARTAVFIVPLRAGGGMRVKIPDAWCWGVPVVSTSIGAEGIDLRDGDQALIADTPRALAEAVISILEEPALGERLRQDGRCWVEERYDWRTVYRLWDKVYEELSVT